MTKATQDFHGWRMREPMGIVRYRSMSESLMVEEWGPMHRDC